MKYQVEINQIYNFWTVLNNDPIKKKSDNHIFIKCKCKCGYEGEVRIDSLIKGVNKSCHKCIAQARPNRHKKIGDISNSFFNDIKSNALQRKLEFTITQDFVWNLFLKQNKLCKLSGIELQISALVINNKADRENTTASLDRIDSSKGYIPGNVQWVHKWVNIMKGCLSDEQFISICKIVNDFNKKDNIEPIPMKGYMLRKQVYSNRSGATHRE